MAYQDFELEISSDGGTPRQYFGKVLKSPAGEAPRAPLKFWFAEPEKLAKLRTDLEGAVLQRSEDANFHGLSSRGEQVLRDFGREIFRSVFVNVPSIQDIYSRSKGASQDLRLKLRIESPELAGLPWEFLYEENEIPSYVSLRLPVVRYLETAGAAAQMGVKGPLRILFMISDPGTEEWPPLNVVKERNRINKALDELQSQGRVEFEWVTGGTGKDLMDKLQGQQWHIFHFVGHGGIEAPLVEKSPFDESGFIVMMDENGKPVKKFASDLATMLLGARKSLRLVVLNCCESAKIGNVGEKFGNPAIGLMRSGWLPAVVAMQFPITDGAAIRMSTGFYMALANNQPVDQAITVARQYIQDQSRVEWGIPVLYMRSDDGQIFLVDNPLPAASERGGAPRGRLSREEVQQRRQEFMAVSTTLPTSAEELERLTQRGQELLAQSKGDQELIARLARVYIELGGLQQRQNEIAKAAASFAYALKLEPDSIDYRVRSANFNVLVGFHENALADIGGAIRLQPDNADLYWKKGIICVVASGPENKRGFLEDAIQAFSVAIEKKPQESKFFATRANAYSQTGERDKALSDIDRAIDLAQDNADLLVQRARIAARAV
jgi:tetratricopeptide (TPR) repeat protein